MYATLIDTINETLDLQYLLLMEEILRRYGKYPIICREFYTSLVLQDSTINSITNTKVNTDSTLAVWQSRATPTSPIRWSTRLDKHARNLRDVQSEAG